MSYRALFKCFSSVWVFVCLMAWQLQVQAFELPLADEEQHLSLMLDDEPSQILQVQRAKLMPIDQPVKVASRLIVESSQALNSAHLPVNIQHMELLHVYAGRYLYVLRFDSVASALGTMAQLQDSPLVLSVQPDILPLRRKPSRNIAQPYPLVTSGDHFTLKDYAPLAAIWQKTRGAGMKVAVIDTGVNLSHPSFNQVPLAFAWDADLNTPLSLRDQEDLHGSYVAGVIWAQPQGKALPLSGNTAQGVAPEADMINVRLRYPWTSHVIRAFALAEQQGAQVINVSWLLPWVASPLQAYLRYLTQVANQGKGVVIVVAANPRPVTNIGLAAMPELLVVSSTDHINQLAHASWDENVDLAVVSYIPSVAFISPRFYGTFSKTSASAPLLAGLVALFRALRPDLTASQLQLLLMSTGTTASALRLNGDFVTYRYLNSYKAHQKLLEK